MTPSPKHSPPGQGQSQESVFIMIMGATGSGKTTFINRLRGAGLTTSSDGLQHGLKSNTSAVQATEPLDVFGKKIVLIDTPGFDDTNKSDIEVLELIAEYLSTSYKDGKQLSGIIYLHDISAKRFTGTSRRNTTMLQKFCGDQVMKNVVIVTTMWEAVTQDIGAARELELREFFKTLLSAETRMHRHLDTTDSARDIVLQIADNTPHPLSIQTQLIDKKMPLGDTDAGKEIALVLEKDERRFRTELEDIQAEISRARLAKDELLQRELQEQSERYRADIVRASHDRTQMSLKFSDHNSTKQHSLNGGSGASWWTSFSESVQSWWYYSAHRAKFCLGQNKGRMRNIQ